MKHKISKDSSLEQMAAIVCSALKENGINVVLSGGAVVSIYTGNENPYPSYDLDFIREPLSKKVDDVMKALGFTKDKSKYWVFPDNPFFVEFPSDFLAIGDSTDIKVVELRRKEGTIRLLSPTDSIKDRLASFFYSQNDRQSLDQAVLIARKQEFSMKDVEAWSRKERQIEKFEIFKKRVEETAKSKK